MPGRIARTCALLFGALLLPLAALGETVSAQAVKAAYLVKFPPFVEWPATPDMTEAPLVLCVIGEDGFARMLGRAALGQKAGRAVAVKHLALPDESCNMLYVETGAAPMLALVEGRPVLTVTDAGSEGAIISFVRERQHMRFDIDLGAARRQGLTISSKLLGLARKVTGEAAP